MYSYGTSILLVCRLCKASFQIVDHFIDHKKEEHSVEFRTSNCIVFEDILILNTNNDVDKDMAGTLSTVREKDKLAPWKENLRVPVAEIECNLTDVDLDITQQNPQNDLLADLYKPFPITKIDFEKDGNNENQESTTSYQDEGEASNPCLQENDGYQQETVESYQASSTVNVSFELIKTKPEFIEFEKGDADGAKHKHKAASVELNQFPQNPRVLIKKLSSKEIQNYSRLLQNEETVNADEVTFNSQCRLCLKKCNSEAELELHSSLCNTFDQNKRHRHRYCSPCNKFFSSKWYRNVHKIRVHGTEEEKRKLFQLKCSVCQKVFVSKDALSSHVESHKGTKNAGNKPFTCDTCSASFFWKYKLARHQSMHALSLPFECPQPDCGKAFKLKEYLMRHCRFIHSSSGESFQCPEPNRIKFHHGTGKEERNLCGNIRVRKQGYLPTPRPRTGSHKGTNEGPTKRFKCDKCSASFYLKYYLTRHQSKHSLERPFPCPELGCGKAFKQKDRLQKHSREVHSTSRESLQCPEPKCRRRVKCRTSSKKHSKMFYTTEAIQ